MEEASILDCMRKEPDRAWSRSKLVKRLLRNAKAKANANASVLDMISKKNVQEALYRLIGSSQICISPTSEGEKNRYILTAVDSTTMKNNESRGEVPLEEEDEKEDSSTPISIPFAEQMRRNKAAAAAAAAERMTFSSEQNDSASIPNNNDDTPNVDVDVNVDLDDEIQRLEAELLQQASDDSSDQDDDDESSVMSDEGGSIGNEGGTDDHKKTISFGDTTVVSIGGDIIGSPSDNTKSDDIICLSSVADDRIAPLPSTALPQMTRRTLKNIDGAGDTNNSKNSSSLEGGNKKRKRRSEKTKEDLEEDNSIRDTVKEMLGTYVARSSERLPFYCRVCALQLTNEDEFLTHRRTNFHKMAVQVEQKATYCRLCRKQFTSPIQMQEHLASRPHKQKMDVTKARQRGEIIPRHPPGNHRNSNTNINPHGRNNNNYHPQRAPQQQQTGGTSKRQWC
eukprot:scaffold168042_cov48-Attheya_sp.AAC.2